MLPFNAVMDLSLCIRITDSCVLCKSDLHHGGCRVYKNLSEIKMLIWNKEPDWLFSVNFTCCFFYWSFFQNFV